MAEVNDWAPSADSDRDASERDQEVSSTLKQKKYFNPKHLINFNKIYNTNLIKLKR